LFLQDRSETGGHLLSSQAIALVLLAACIHATWNFWVKKAEADPLAFSFLCSLASTLIYLPAVLWLVGWQSVLDLSARQWAFIAVSSVVHNLYFFILQTGYARSDLSIVYPLARGTGPMISAVGAMLLFAEKPTLFSVSGLILVVLGTFTIAGGFALMKAGNNMSTKVRAGLIWGPMTGACIACYTLLDAYSVKFLLIAPLLFDWISGPIRGVFLLPFIVQQKTSLSLTWAQSWKYIVGIAAISPLGYILVLTAMQKAPISLVAPAREVSMLFAAFLGAKLLHEGNLRRRVFGAGLIALGVVALASSG
jgi:uncharacterized membrane protein